MDDRPRTEASGGSEDRRYEAIGGPQLLEAVYRAHRDGVVRMCRVLLRDPSDAEDAMQEAFVRAAPAILTGTCNPSPYLYMTARNICRDILRLRGRRDVRELTPEMVAQGPLPDDQAFARFSLERAWRMLSRRDRMLLSHSVSGFAYEEIAGRSGLSAKAVSVGLTRARARVRRAVDGLAAVLGTVPARWVGARRWRPWQPGRTACGDVWRILTSRLFSEVASAVVALCAVCAGSVVGPAGLGMAPAAHRPETPVALPAAATALPLAERLITQGSRTPPPHPVASRASASDATPSPSPPPPPGVGNVWISSVTTSPSYSQDHTLFAEGVFGPTPFVFESVDGGESWTRKAALGFAGGAIVVSPSWASDHRLLAGTDVGLQESDDDGTTWATVIAMPGSIAVTPDPMGIGLRVVIAGPVLVTYNTATRTVTLGPRPPLGLIPTSIAYAGDADHVVVAGAMTNAGDAIVRCGLAATCSTVTTWGPSAYNSVAGSAGAPTETILALGNYQAYVSRDGGLSFEPVACPMGVPTSLAVPSQASGLPPIIGWGRLDGITHQMVRGVAALGDGTAATPMPASIPMGVDIAAATLLPGGRLLVVQTWGTDGVLSGPISWWSDDGGRSWHHSTTA